MKKKVDDRIRTVIENGVKTRHRSMFIIVGDKSRDQIVNLHYMMSKAVIKSRPTVLWCYKDKLELSSHKKKRAKQVKKLMQRGLLDPEKVDPFSLFVESGGLTYCLYKDSDRILGNTFGMCILPSSGLISVESNRDKSEKHGKQKDHKRNEKRGHGPI